MPIKVSLYDLFAHTIPGGLYLLTLIYFLTRLGVITLDFNMINNFSSWLIIIGVTTAYTLGLLLDPLASRVAGVFFRPMRNKAILEQFRIKYQDIDFQFESKDASILRAYVKMTNTDLGDNIDRAGANQTMFRNFGLNFLMLSAISLIHFFQSLEVIFIPGSICVISLSLLAFSEHKKWRLWFHQITYESVAAIALKEQVLVKHKSETNHKITKQELLEILILQGLNEDNKK
jgi:hypothetical protein